MESWLKSIVKYQGAGASERGLSGALWSRVPSHALDPRSAKFIYEEFDGFGGLVAANVGGYASPAGWYRSYEDTGGAIAQLATSVTGVVEISSSSTDNHESWLQHGGAASVFGKVSTTDGSNFPLIFECRVNLDQIASGNAFVGLGEEGLAAADTITDAGALASKDLIGFQVLEATPTVWDFVYRKAGQAAQVVRAGVHTQVADTFVKLGFAYNPKAPNAQKITAYINGVELGYYVTATNLAAAAFPLGEELSPLFGVKNGAATAKKLRVDWWAAYQQISE